MIEQSEILEECYEYFLSYAARGLRAEKGSQPDAEVREYLEWASEALYQLESVCAHLLASGSLQPTDKFEAFFAILIRDAHNAAVTLELVASLPSIGSQIIDNLNGLMHLRSVLTDLFLATELLKTLTPATAN
jgi:hypothetical protein